MHFTEMTGDYSFPHLILSYLMYTIWKLSDQFDPIFFAFAQTNQVDFTHVPGFVLRCNLLATHGITKLAM